MAWAPLLLTLLTYCSGVSSQPVVTQEPSMSVTPGGSVTLSCSLSTGAVTTSNYPAWYQQKAGSAPRLLIYETNKRPSGIPARFSGSISGNNAALTITGVQAEDEADYYCLIYTGSGSSTIFVFGGGTQLTVLGQPKASPTMHLFPPSSEEIKTKSKATLVCLLGSFYPGSVQITWKADGQQISTGVETTKPSKQSDNKFMASSYLSLDASKWKTHDTYTCQVTHDGKNFEKSLKSSECS
ncbi:immunoglobulin lambda-1 light chain-like isoform X10 [Dermochelys coriacea]|uniref:immunoglobulin lambda-1 light chain-like isoform X10 n=1 Tax=Dermochelys coriacea TaxID=27794 RepID=UPI001CA82BA2|nr:immunoglobulin lambda-1 light chain-like isoform X10 [Dermochelys coriacea]